MAKNPEFDVTLILGKWTTRTTDPEMDVITVFDANGTYQAEGQCDGNMDDVVISISRGEIITKCLRLNKTYPEREALAVSWREMTTGAPIFSTLVPIRKGCE